MFLGDASGSRWPQHRFADLLNPQQPQREFFWATRQAWGEVRFLDRGRLPERSASLVQFSDLQRLRQLQYCTEGPVRIAYDLPRDAAVTLVVERPDGRRVRNLIADYPRHAGTNVDAWDGADDNGRVVPPGQYRAAACSTTSWTPATSSPMLRRAIPLGKRPTAAAPGWPTTCGRWA